MKKNRVGVFSAHEGALYWTRLVSTVNAQPGISLEMLHDFSDSEYRAPKSRFGRLALRVRTYILYPIRCILTLLLFQKRYDAFLVVTSPFFLPALIARISRKPVVSLQNDIYPEALVLAGVFRRGSIPERCIKKLCSPGVKRAASVVYLCEGHRAIGERDFGVNGSTHVIPVGAFCEEFRDSPPSEAPLPISFLYCGTMGMMHDSSAIEDFLAKEALPSGCRLEFLTSGAGKPRFERAIRNTFPELLDSGKIVLGNPLDDAAWHAKMKSSQVGMVFQSVGAENVVFPSKVFSILVAGQAVLAIVSPDCELGRLVRAHDCGWVVSPGEIDGLRQVFHEALDARVLLRKRANAFALGHSRYDIDKLACTWREILLNACGAADTR